MLVDFRTVRGVVVEYALVLTWVTADEAETIRVYDSAHGFNEMHRYTRAGGKQAGIDFHAGRLEEGMRAAMADIKTGYLAMIEGWKA